MREAMAARRPPLPHLAMTMHGGNWAERAGRAGNMCGGVGWREFSLRHCVLVRAAVEVRGARRVCGPRVSLVGGG